MVATPVLMREEFMILPLLLAGVLLGEFMEVFIDSCLRCPLAQSAVVKNNIAINYDDVETKDKGAIAIHVLALTTGHYFVDVSIFVW